VCKPHGRAVCPLIGVDGAYLALTSGPFIPAVSRIHCRGYDRGVFQALVAACACCGNSNGNVAAKPGVARGIDSLGTSCVVPDVSLEHDDDDDDDEGAAFFSASSTIGGYLSQM
jgi:hypothetical protein